MNSTLRKTLWTIWAVITLILIATLTTNLEITNGWVSKVLIYIFISGFTALVTFKKQWTLLKKLTVSTVLFGLFLILKLFLDLRGDWKTQSIIYKNRHLSNRTIEFQLQDIGAFGYNRRTIDRIKLFPFVSWSKNLTEENLENVDSLSWDKVDIEVNEQGLKGG